MSLIVTAQDLSKEAKAVAKLDDFVYFVDNLLPGEEAEIEVIKRKKKYAIASVKNRMSSHPQRVKESVRSTHATEHMSYEMQCEYKQSLVEQSLQRIGNLNISVEPIIASKKEWNYRNKADCPILFLEGSWKMGRFIKNSSIFVPEDNADLYYEEVVDALNSVLKILPENNSFSAYRLIVRYSKETEQMLISIVTRRKEKMECIVQELFNQLPKLVGITHHVMKNYYGYLSRTTKVWKSNFFYEQLGDNVFKVSAESFFQSNLAQMGQAIEYIKESEFIKDSEHILELYCGVGSLGQCLIEEGQSIIGVESNPSAIQMAKQNAINNKVENATYIEEDAIKSINMLEYVDTLIVDPPRKGLDSKLVSNIVQSSIEKIIYVSCDPVSLARDISIFSKNYKVLKVQPFDFFPQTNHVETVALLSKLDSD